MQYKKCEIVDRLTQLYVRERQGQASVAQCSTAPTTLHTVETLFGFTEKGLTISRLKIGTLMIHLILFDHFTISRDSRLVIL